MKYLWLLMALCLSVAACNSELEKSQTSASDKSVQQEQKARPISPKAVEDDGENIEKEVADCPCKNRGKAGCLHAKEGAPDDCPCKNKGKAGCPHAKGAVSDAGCPCKDNDCPHLKGAADGGCPFLNKAAKQGECPHKNMAKAGGCPFSKSHESVGEKKAGGCPFAKGNPEKELGLDGENKPKSGGCPHSQH